MQYNLIKNASLSYSIIDAAGLNRVLDNDELSYLIDEDLGTTNSVQIVADETIQLVASFGRRIKIDAFRLYLHSATVSGVTTSGVVLNNIDFYYKNYDEDSYTVLNDKDVGAENYYYATIPFPMAPCSVQVTLSGVVGSISEFATFNDAYSVAFGTDGNLQTKYVVAEEDTTNWETQSLPIYNNGTNSVQEYISAIICIDYTGDAADNYLKIADSSYGPFVGIEDGVLIENNELTYNYTWDMGRFSNTHIVSNKLVLEDIDDLTSYYTLGAKPYKGMSTGDSNFAIDEVNKVMYVLFDQFFLELHKYYYTTDTWEFIGKINPGCTGFGYYANITYLDGYAYIMYNNNPDSFGRYEIDGEENNWESLSDLPLPSFTDIYKLNIMSDGTEYIYGITVVKNTSARAIDIDGQGWFGRYSTISGSVAGWEELSNQYYHSCLPIF